LWQKLNFFEAVAKTRFLYIHFPIILLFSLTFNYLCFYVLQQNCKKGKIKLQKCVDSFTQNSVKIGIWNLMENTNFGISNFLENPADIGVL